MQAIGRHAVRRAPAVTEAEILQGLFSAIGSVITIFSLLFTMVSGYLAALYLFLGHAPFALRLMAFALLSSGLVFLGGSVAVIQTMQNGLFAAWAKLPSPAIDLRELRNPLPLELSGMVPFSQQQIGVGVGWASAGVCLPRAGLSHVHLSLAVAWPRADRRRCVRCLKHRLCAAAATAARSAATLHATKPAAELQVRAASARSARGMAR